MDRLRSIASLLLIVFWLPASSHALLEYAGLIHNRHADREAESSGSQERDSDNHEAADGKCALASTHVSAPAPDTTVTPFLLRVLGLEWTSDLHVELQASGLSPPGTAPPQLSRRWQFSFRTALPPRAPSLIS